MSTTTAKTTKARSPLAQNSLSNYSEKVDGAVMAWVDGYLRNSDFSQNTPAWNHFMNGLPTLIAGIVKEVEGK